MTLIYRNVPLEVEEGTSYRSLAERFAANYDAPILLAKVGQQIVELTKRIPARNSLLHGEPEPRELTFITSRERDGHKTYERGATMMFLRAMTHVFEKTLSLIKLEYAIGDSLYFSLRWRESPQEKDGVDPNDRYLTPEKIAEVLRTMEQYVRDKERFIKLKLPTREVIELFRQQGMPDKEQLFRYRISSLTNVYRFGDFIDYYYGYMPPSADYVDIFDLKKTDGGILLVLPNKNTPQTPGDPRIPRRLFATMRNSNTWSENIGVPTVASLNNAISNGRGREIILASEAYQEHLIGEIARRIREENRRIVMIAGPSSSGKTSFSHRLSIQLNNVGIKAHPIGCDNYYVDRELTPRDEAGDFDYECLEALDIEQFNRDMTGLLRGDRVELPTFNFRSGHREYTGNTLRLGPGEVLVIEGIHGLNEQLSYRVRPDDKFRVYVSTLTTLNVDEHNRIPTTDHREIRRMVRDARTRGFSATETISRWLSVRRGEERHIFPFQEDADVIFNSAALYELAVLKTFAEPLLYAIPTDAPEFSEAKRLLKFLSYFLGLSCEDVPRNSIVREFIGGSIFPVE